MRKLYTDIDIENIVGLEAHHMTGDTE
ncbi:hypothetical protein CN1A_4 [Clavibacter phage CN1A]|uniref:Uncharacterized protein n=1 Tax=Clavibacter phage CN1A TaxID=1406793 RepID=U5PXD9_9CAUD|nr:hypothetical protein CN1A_4 [Clavibacter phage CN1A]AGY47113.1 hypothetical protein CN1A_4 [Clavibacter phage CN1A]